jgi:hypothetical protein
VSLDKAVNAVSKIFTIYIVFVDSNSNVNSTVNSKSID